MGSWVRFCVFAFWVVTLAACAGAPAGSTFTELVELDMHVAGGGDATVAGPVLAMGETYRLYVVGTYSIWGESMWSSGTCLGTADSAPMFPSPGGSNVWVGVDAEYYYAIPDGSALCSEPFPNQTGRFEMSVDGGTDWFHPLPVGGLTGPSATHEYEYDVMGGGVPIEFRRLDSPSEDNYGILRITITGD